MDALRDRDGMQTENGIDIFWNSPIGPFVRDISIIGQGGFGTVYKAFHTALDRHVAIKLLNRAVLDDEVAIARFMREARALQSMNHPNVVRVYSCGQTTDGRPYMMMEYLVGRTLTSEIVNSGGTLSVERAKDLLEQIAKGVSSMHENRLIHRDLTPNNCIVLADDSGLVKIFDFGLVKSLTEGATENQRLTKTAEICGTVAYIAPEAWLGEPIDARSDIYALGCLLYLLVTGRPPFVDSVSESCGLQHVSSDVSPAYIAMQGDKVYPNLEVVLKKCLAKRPADRYQTADDLADALSDLQLAVPLAEYQESWKERFLRDSDPFRVILIAALGLLVILCTWYKFREPERNDENRLVVLRSEEKSLISSLLAADGALLTGVDPKTVKRTRNSIFDKKVEIAEIFARKFLSEKMLKYRNDAFITYESALPFSDNFSDTFAALLDLSRLANMEPKRVKGTSMSMLWMSEASRAIKEKRFDDALVFYRAYSLDPLVRDADWRQQLPLKVQFVAGLGTAPDRLKKSWLPIATTCIELCEKHHGFDAPSETLVRLAMLTTDPVRKRFYMARAGRAVDSEFPPGLTRAAGRTFVATGQLMVLKEPALARNTAKQAVDEIDRFHGRGSIRGQALNILAVSDDLVGNHRAGLEEQIAAAKEFSTLQIRTECYVRCVRMLQLENNPETTRKFLPSVVAQLDIAEADPSLEKLVALSWEIVLDLAVQINEPELATTNLNRMIQRFPAVSMKPDNPIVIRWAQIALANHMHGRAAEKRDCLRSARQAAKGDTELLLQLFPFFLKCRDGAEYLQLVSMAQESIESKKSDKAKYDADYGRLAGTMEAFYSTAPKELGIESAYTTKMLEVQAKAGRNVPGPAVKP